MGEDFPPPTVVKAEVKPKKEIVLDPSYINIVVPDDINWTEKAQAAGLKAVDLGSSYLTDMHPTRYFKVITQGNILWYDKTSVLSVVKPILQGAATDDEKIKDFCRSLIKIEENIQKFLGNSTDVVAKMHSSEEAVKGGQFERSDYEKHFAAYESEGIKRFKVPLEEPKQKEITRLFDKLKTDIKALESTSVPKARVKILEEYKADLNAYQKYVSDTLFVTNIQKHPELNNINNVSMAIDKEIKALKTGNIAGRLAEIDSIDKRVVQLIESSNKSFSKEGIVGTPGVSLFEARELLTQRAKLVNELKEWMSSPEEAAAAVKEEEARKKESNDVKPWTASITHAGIRLLESKGEGLLKQWSGARQNLASDFTTAQKNILAELLVGTVRTEKPKYVFGKQKRTDAEIANEIRPILTTVMAKGMLLNDLKAQRDAKILALKLSTFGDRGVWAELFRPNGQFDEKLHAFHQGWATS